MTLRSRSFMNASSSGFISHFYTFVLAEGSNIKL